MAIKTDSLEVLITANTAQITSALNKVTSQLGQMGAVTQGISSKVGGSLVGSFTKANIISQVLFASLRGLANGFKAFGNAIKSAGSFILDATKETQKFESALIGLETVARRKLGVEGIKEATEASKELASDGLMSIQESATGLKNLLASGFSLPEATNLMNTFRDAAAFGRQGSLEFGQAVVTATEGIKNGNSILVDNAGITKNLSIILKEAGFSQQDLSRATTDASVRQALYNGILKEGNIFQGDAARLMGTTAGQASTLSAIFRDLRVKIGQLVKPIQQVLQGALITLLGGIQGSFAQTEDRIKTFVVRVAGFLVALIRMIGVALSRLPLIGKNFKALINFSIPAAKAVNDIANSGDSASDGLDSASDSAKKLGKELRGLAGFDELNVLTQPEKDSETDAVSPIVDVGGGGLSDFITDSSADINNFADETIGKFAEIGRKIREFLEPIMAIGRGISEIWNRTVIPVLTKVGSIIGKFISPAVSGLVAVFGELWQSIKDSPLMGWLKLFMTYLTAISLFISGAFLVGFTVAIKAIVYIITGLVYLIRLWFDAWTRQWDSVKLKIDRFISGIKNIPNAFNDVKNRVVGYLSTIGSWVNGIFDRMGDRGQRLKNIFVSIGSAIVSALKFPINTLIDAINRFFRLLNGTKIPDWVPVVGGKGFSLPYIPRLAEGGTVTSPTLAMMGEGGYKEAVIPLDRNTDWADRVAELINGASGGGSTNLVVKLGEETIFEKMIDWVNDRNLQTNSSVIRI